MNHASIWLSHLGQKCFIMFFVNSVISENLFAQIFWNYSFLSSLILTFVFFMMCLCSFANCELRSMVLVDTRWTPLNGLILKMFSYVPVTSSNFWLWPAAWLVWTKQLRTIQERSRLELIYLVMLLKRDTLEKKLNQCKDLRLLCCNPLFVYIFRGQPFEGLDELWNYLFLMGRNFLELLDKIVVDIYSSFLCSQFISLNCVTDWKEVWLVMEYQIVVMDYLCVLWHWRRELIH